MNGNDHVLKVAAFCGATLAVFAAGDGDLTSPKSVAASLAAGFAALVALLRPPSTPSGFGGRG